MLPFYVRLGMVVEKVHEIVSFEESKWLKIYTNFKTQKRTLAKNDFDKDFYELLNNAFHGNRMENVRNRIKLEFFKKVIIKEI